MNIVEILKITGIPFAYDHFAEGESPKPPFICYLYPGSNNFAADGRVYFKVNDPQTEKKLEDAFDEAGIFYNKTETWIESEKLYEVLYIFEMED